MFRLPVFLAILLIFAIPCTAYARDDKGGPFFDLGVFAFEAKNFVEAETNLKKALSLGPDNPLYHHYLGKTYLGMQRYDLAEEHLRRAERLDAELVGLSYDLAVLYYETERYAQAVEFYRKVIRDAPENILAHYQCGISLYRQQKYKEALFYFTTASEMSPTIKTNGYFYAGICSLKVGDYDTAIERLNYVRENTDSETLRSHALKWLNNIEKQKKQLKPYHLFLKAGYQYDSNVTLDPVDEDFITEEDDFLATVYFSGSFNLLEADKGRYVFGVGYNHYMTMHNRLTEYDLTGSMGNVYARANPGPLRFSIAYIPHYYWLDREDYLRRHQIMPEVVWQARSNLIVRFSYSYYDNDYFTEDGRDGQTHEPVLSGYYFFGRQRGYVFGGAGYEANSARSPDQDYGRLLIRGGLSHNLFWRLKLAVNVRYYGKRYDNVDSNYTVRREDDKYYGGITLSRPLFYDWLKITAEYNYTKNNSNISVFEYRRHVGTVYLSTRF